MMGIFDLKITDCSLEDYINAGKEWKEELGPGSDVGFNIYFYKSRVPRTSDEDPSYVIRLRLEITFDEDGEYILSYGQAWDKIWSYATRAELKSKEEELKGHLDNFSKYLEDFGFHVSNLWESRVSYDKKVSVDEEASGDTNKDEMSEDDLEFLFNIMSEVERLNKLG